MKEDKSNKSITRIKDNIDSKISALEQTINNMSKYNIDNKSDNLLKYNLKSYLGGKTHKNNRKSNTKKLHIKKFMKNISRKFVKGVISEFESTAKSIANLNGISYSQYLNDPSYEYSLQILRNYLEMRDNDIRNQHISINRNQLSSLNNTTSNHNLTNLSRQLFEDD